MRSANPQRDRHSRQRRREAGPRRSHRRSKGKILEDGKVRPLDVKVGDRILFGKFSGQAVKVEAPSTS